MSTNRQAYKRIIASDDTTIDNFIRNLTQEDEEVLIID